MVNHRLSIATRGRRGPVRIVSVLALGAALVLSACGSSSKAPAQQAIGQSAGSIGDQSSLSVRVSLGLTAAQIQQLSQRNGGTGITTAQADALSSGSIFFNVKTGGGEPLSSTQAQTDTANSYDLGVQTGSDTPLIEVRYVEQNLYVQAQLDKLLADFGSSAQASSIDHTLQQADQVVPGLAALAQGNWVEVSQASLQSLSGLLNQYASSSGSGGAAINPSQLGTEYGELASDVLAALQANSVTQPAGTTPDGRTHETATLNVHNFLTAVGPELKSDLASIPGVGSNISDQLNQAESKIPANQTVMADLYLQNNTLQEIDVDLNQFASASDKAPFAVPVKAVFGTSPSISPPSNPTPLDLSKLPTLLGGLMGGQGGSSSTSSSGSSTN
jgi:hypothetical protein